MQKSTEVFYDKENGCYYAYTDTGVRFLFDACDKELVQSRGWHTTKRGYIGGKEKRRERPLHKLMIAVDSIYDIDHVNGDKLDYRRQNLRVCSHQQNCFNQRLKSNNSTGYTGVSFAKNVGRYESYVHHNGYKYGLGYFDTAEEAALVRDQKAKELFAYLVFRQGATCTIKEIATILFEEGTYDKREQVYIQKIISSLMKTMRDNNVEEIMNRTYNSLGVKKHLLDCDFFKAIETKDSSNYLGEFIAQYSWAEEFNGFFRPYSS